MADEHEDVRRALADARHTDPVPADVAARLDATLARLAREEPPGSEPAPGNVVTPARLRWRRGVAAAVAVAAVSVVGAVLAQEVLSGSGSGADSSTAGEALDEKAALENGDTMSSMRENGDAGAHADSDEADSALTNAFGAPTVHPDHLRRDVVRALDSAADAEQLNQTARACDPAPDLRGRRVPVVLTGDGAREAGLLVARRTTAGRSVVVLGCDDPAPRFRLDLP